MHAHPEAVTTSTSTAADAVGAGPFEPPAARALRRDQDGAVLSSGRRPGELAQPITGNNDFYIVTKATKSVSLQNIVPIVMIR